MRENDLTVPGELRQISALIATHDLFAMLEGRHSARVHEVIALLLLPELRPALRNWYQRSGAETDSAAIEFRDRLSLLAGERLENLTDIPSTTSGACDRFHALQESSSVCDAPKASEPGSQ